MRIEANDRRGLERLLRCCACPVFALERVEALDAHRLLYRLPKPRLDGKTQLLLSPLELIQRLAALVPPPRRHRHRHRHQGVLAPNAPLRAAVTALIQQAPSDTPAQGQKTETPPSAVEGVWRSPARYLWAMLLARLYESMPLQCPFCSADMRIIACITDGTTVRRILKHIGEPTDPPRISPVRGPPAWWEEGEGQAQTAEQDVSSFDPVAQPEPDKPAGQPVCTATGRPQGAAQGGAAYLPV